MTDKEILDEVYNNAGLPKHLKDFIEQEWQKRDDLGNIAYNKAWYSPTGPEGRLGE